MDEIIQAIAVYAIPVIFAITLHEAAHAYAAKYFGDSTAYLQGRMSANPVKHIDPFGTIVMPIVLYVVTNGAAPLGYAKPVPVDWGKLRKPKRDMGWVALAGPAANFGMAFLWMLFAILLIIGNIREPFFYKMAQAGESFNLLILAFNLLPIPPLDGGRIVTSIMPNKYAYRYAQLEPYGFVIVLALLVLNSSNYWLSTYWIIPVADSAEVLLKVFLSPLNFLLS